MPDTYALIVGIDTYAEPLRALECCVNDANAVRDLLERRYQAQCAVLTNEQATRANIIDGFHNHLGRARPGDSAVFFYAGHGSQVPAGGLFAKIESSGKLQSLVCIDSRPDGYDLVDKDIAVLISELADQGVHVTLMMDSCHSGSISRAADGRADAPKPPLVRSAPDREKGHPPEAFVRRRNVSDAEALSMTLAMVGGFKPDVSGRHVLLAACESSQSSQELADQGHGLFTWCLLQVLESSDEGLTYDELYARVNSLQQQKIGALPGFAPQKPKLESLAGDVHRMGLFLRMTPAPRTEFFLARYMGGQWMLDGGALNRLSPGDKLAVYPAATANRDLKASLAIGTVAVTMTNPAESVLDTQAAALDRGLQYKAVVTQRAAQLNIGVEGDALGVSMLRSSLGLAPSVREATPARIIVRCEEGQIGLTTDSGRKTPGPFAATAEGAAQAAAALEHMAKWIMRLEMTNPLSRIGPQQVQFTVIDKDGREYDCPPLKDLELRSVRDASGAWQEGAFTAKITNRSPHPLSIALLVFSEDWSIFTGLIAGGTEVLEPNLPRNPSLPLYALSGEPIQMTIAPGATEAHDEFLLIVSADDFNADALALKPFASEAVTRGIAAAGAPVPQWQHDFATRRLHVHSVRRED
jgi:hypothetical protein